MVDHFYLIKLILCLQKSHHPFTTYDIWALYIEYLKILSHSRHETKMYQHIHNAIKVESLKKKR
jgi:hypothetical protein